MPPPKSKAKAKKEVLLDAPSKPVAIYLNEMEVMSKQLLVVHGRLVCESAKMDSGSRHNAQHIKKAYTDLTGTFRGCLNFFNDAAKRELESLRYTAAQETDGGD